eukprot:COSAG02_NODE_2919_length_7748_cov_39.701660_3_plen_82_part_00
MANRAQQNSVLRSTLKSKAHNRHHRHLRLAELVWPACLEVADVPYALTLVIFSIVRLSSTPLETHLNRFRMSAQDAAIQVH